MTLTHEPIVANDVIANVAAPEHGAIILFLGVVREVNDGRGVTGIDYSAYEPMAEAELDAIVSEGKARFEPCDIAVVHRLGDLALEDISVAIAVAHPHRNEAYECSRWVIEELKRRVPIWKQEQYVDGTREWVDPTREKVAV